MALDYSNTMYFFLLIVCAGLQCVAAQQTKASVPCYDEFNRAQRCQPPFVNAAFGKVMDVTNTCGVSSETEYCLQTGKTGVKKHCYTCDDRIPDRRHPPSFLTDFNNNRNNTYTWWQSETMLESIQYPTRVNLTLSLKKSFDITYVNLRFYSPRPESFAIYKRTEENGPWIPYQFYSASCELTYNLPRHGVITSENEDQAICTADFSDISPLTGGSVAFSTLEGRPSMFNFNSSPKLQEWVTATDLKIVLTRLNTFGDELFGDPQVLRSYFYAISDLAVGARCKCNGHARECRPVRGQDLTERLECVCEHFTTGQDCDKCLPFYNDKPWGRATQNDAHECQPCDCNGLSNTCEFDPDLYRQTGHGGRCTNCQENTAGVSCEICQVNHFRRNGRCTNCACDPTGSTSLQCDDDGQCPCKPGVGGLRCDRCQEDFFNFGQQGCRPCECFVAGSLNNQPRCDSQTGLCQCKENVDGRQCDKCKPGFFGLSEADPYGCISCFCYGHSSECSAASGYYQANITTNFDTGNQRWSAADRSGNVIDTQFNGVVGNLGVQAEGMEQVYFVSSDRYHGDQRFSYNQMLTFDLRLGSDESTPTVMDVIVEGSGGKKIHTHIFAQDNEHAPDSTAQTFAFRIHENKEYLWRPTLNAVEFIGVLANVTAIKIRGTYSKEGVGFIDNIKLGTARQGYIRDGVAATNVEQCVCNNGHIGQFCEACQPGYKREIPNGGAFSRCVPCECNNHSGSCDRESGKCICQDNTEGDFCERCARGYYGDATNGQSDDCTQCPCPNGGACIQMLNGDVVCTECDEGYGGNLCDICIDGYSGDPMGKKTGVPTPCTKCLCSGNIDPNAVGNCNTTTGICKKCIRNTGGDHCQDCLPDFYNNTLGLCTACNCYTPGTKQVGQRICDVTTGQCNCQPNVGGKHCDHSQPGFYNINLGNGSVPCNCDMKGSLNFTCDESTGQCQCKPGVAGRRCDVCAPLHYGHSDAGCKPCNCDPVGSLSAQCDVEHGYCQCKPNVDGPRCDRCEENKYDLASGCLDCPECYNLVQDAVNEHRGKLKIMVNTIMKTESDPSLFNNSAFVSELNRVHGDIDLLLRNARDVNSGSGTVGDQLEKLRQSLRDVLTKTDDIARNIPSVEQAAMEAEKDRKSADDVLKRAKALLKQAMTYIEKEGQQAVREALTALAEFGEHDAQITEIAQNATRKAEEQTDQAKAIKDMSDKARNTSLEAQQLARDAFNQPSITADEITKLQNEAFDAKNLFEATIKAANASQIRANKIKTDSLDLLIAARKDLGDADLDMLKSTSDAIKEQAEDIIKQANDLIADNQDLMDKVKNQTQQAEVLLEDGKDINQKLDDLLSEADHARAMARDAVEKATKTLKEANDTLNTLKDFENLTSNKQKAEDKMKEVQAINDTINKAIEITQQAVNSLKQVEGDANKALNIAKEAKKKATEASEEAKKMRVEAADSKSKADAMKTAAENNKDDVELVKSAVSNFTENVDDDENAVTKALRDAGEVKKNADKILNKVENYLALIIAATDDLGKYPNPDDKELDKLEKMLNDIEKDFNSTEVDNEFENLKKRSDDGEQMLLKVQADLAGLIKDVENIKEITEALPTGCFKDIDSEKPGGV